MQQLLLFQPRAGLEQTYLDQIPTFRQWAEEGRITWKQFHFYRRQAEYQLIIHNRSQSV